MAEKSMMAEAREKVVALCEELAPKDVLPLEAVGSLIESLGFDRLKEQRLGFRQSKLSISEKFALAKRRMEESKAFGPQPASYPSRLQNTSAAGENHETPPTSQGLSSDTMGHIHICSAPPTLSFRPPGTEVRPSVVSSAGPCNIGIDSFSMVSSTFDRAHLRPPGRPNEPSFVPTHPVSTSTDQHAVKSTPVPLQPQSASRANIANNGVPDHLPMKANGNATLGASRGLPHVTGQTPKPVVAQTTPGTLPAMYHPAQGMHFVPASPAFSRHFEISKLVLKLLDSKLPEDPAWIPPSRDYMNRAVTCQFCKLIINQVENVLVCDACEKGFHLQCLQSYNANGIPRGEWHCPECLSMNGGKPFLPSYGRVTRNMTGPKVAFNTAGVQMSAEKKVNQSNIVSNGNSEFKIHPQAVEVSQCSSESNLQHGNKIRENDMFTDIKGDEGPNLMKCPKDVTRASIKASLSTSNGHSNVQSHQQEVKSEVSLSEGGLVSEAEPKCPFVSHVSGTSDQSPTSSNQKDSDQERLSNGVDAPAHQLGNCNGILEYNKCDDGNGHQKDGAVEHLHEMERVLDQAGELAKASDNSLPSVAWSSGTVRMEGEKKFFSSCCINGVVYKVHDYALFRSGDKLIPLKIQAMWEDLQTCSKWFIVHKCYFPDDLPVEVGRPGAPQSNEVYESTQDSHVMASFIQGPCEVLPFRTFKEETGRSNQCSQANDRTWPFFIRSWFYDESRRVFCATAS